MWKNNWLHLEFCGRLADEENMTTVLTRFSATEQRAHVRPQVRRTTPENRNISKINRWKMKMTWHCYCYATHVLYVQLQKEHSRNYVLNSSSRTVCYPQRGKSLGRGLQFLTGWTHWSCLQLWIYWRQVDRWTDNEVDLQTRNQVEDDKTGLLNLKTFTAAPTWRTSRWSNIIFVWLV